MVKTTKKTTATKPHAPAAKKKTQKRKTSRTSYTEPFMVVHFSRETMYWIVLGVIAVGFGIWVLMLQQRVNDLYRQIDTLNTANEILDMKQRYYKNHPERVSKKTVPLKNEQKIDKAPESK